jgi:formyl-CoA transferase
MTNLLEGVRVVETGVLMTVDHLGRLLGDEGADVVKVETPQLGDYLRNIMVRFGPDNSVFHLVLNRNKRSVTVNARTPEVQAIMARLIAGADVFITGNVGATNAKLGLDYESVQAIKPDIVYCQATGYGARRRTPKCHARSDDGRPRRCRQPGARRPRLRRGERQWKPA